MTEHLYQQIAAAEESMRASEARIANMRDLRSAVAELVGRAEGADGKIVVECTNADGLKTLELDPRAMRLPSMDLAAEIKSTIAAAQADLRDQVQRAISGMGISVDRLTPEQVREQLATAREQFIDTARDAAGRVSEADRLLRERGAR